MGPCRYCKQMIYLDWIAERGYHRHCHAKAIQQKIDSSIQQRVALDRHEREHDKRRERKRLKRTREKALRKGATP